MNDLRPRHVEPTNVERTNVERTKVRLTFKQGEYVSGYDRGVAVKAAKEWLRDQGQVCCEDFDYWTPDPLERRGQNWVFSFTSASVATLFKLRWSHYL